MSRPAWWWALPVLLLAAWMGARGLNADAIWYDEYWSLYNAGAAHYGPLAPAGVWARIAAEDPWQAPAYYTLLNLWGGAAGWTPFAGRLLSLLTGLLAIAWTYRLGRAVSTPLVGFSAATALGGSAFFGAYLHELRGYTLYALFTALLAWGGWRLLAARRPGRAARLALVAGAAGLLYTHYFAALPLAAFGLYLALAAPKNRRWLEAVALLALAGLLFLPWAGVLLDALSRTVDPNLPPPAAADLLAETLAALESLARALGNGFAPLLLAPLAAALVWARGRGAGYAGWLALATLALGLAANAALPLYFHPRYAMALWPLAAVVIGLGLAALGRLRLRPAAVVGVWLAAGVWAALDPGYIAGFTDAVNTQIFRPGLPWQIVAARLKAEVGQDDVVILHMGRWSWGAADVFKYYVHDLPVRYAFMDWLPGDAVQYAERAREYTASAARVWLGREDGAPVDFRLAGFEAALARFAPCGPAWAVPGLAFELYALRPLLCGPPAGAARAVFDDWARLLAVEWEAAGGELVVWHTWQVDAAVPPGGYSVGLYLLDAAGQVVAQADGGLPAGRFAYRRAVLATAGLPPGVYRLAAAVYDWQTGARLAGAAADGEVGDLLTLAEIRLLED